MPGFADREEFRKLILTYPRLAINELYIRYRGALVHIAEQRVNDRKAAEDIVQDAFMVLWEKFEWVANQKDILVGPYLIGIVKLMALRYYTTSTRVSTKNPIEVLEELLFTKPSVEIDFALSDKHQTLHNIVDILPNRERECIQMRFFREMSIDSIASQLGVTSKAVEKNITNGLKRLRGYKSSMY